MSYLIIFFQKKIDVWSHILKTEQSSPWWMGHILELTPIHASVGLCISSLCSGSVPFPKVPYEWNTYNRLNWFVDTLDARAVGSGLRDVWTISLPLCRISSRVSYNVHRKYNITICLKLYLYLLDEKIIHFGWNIFSLMPFAFNSCKLSAIHT